jgi:hypothetical protein
MKRTLLLLHLLLVRLATILVGLVAVLLLSLALPFFAAVQIPSSLFPQLFLLLYGLV